MFTKDQKYFAINLFYFAILYNKFLNLKSLVIYVRALVADVLTNIVVKVPSHVSSSGFMS